MDLNAAELGKEYTITDVELDGDEELESFLFSLGCYSGEKITVVDKKKKSGGFDQGCQIQYRSGTGGTHPDLRYMPVT